VQLFGESTWRNTDKYIFFYTVSLVWTIAFLLYHHAVFRKSQKKIGSSSPIVRVFVFVFVARVPDVGFSRTVDARPAWSCSGNPTCVSRVAFRMRIAYAIWRHGGGYWDYRASRALIESDLRPSPLVHG